MKSKMFFFCLVLISAGVFSCSDDKEVKRKGDADIQHDGAKWNVTSISNFVLSDVGMTGVTSKQGSASNAGVFYFIEGENKGSFEFTVEGYNKEDYFTFEKDANNNITIVNIEQSVGVTTNQNILAISGTQTSDTEITLDAISIMKQSSATGVFTLTATTITLVKQ